MSASLFLLAAYQGWMGKSSNPSSISRFTQSTLFDVNLMRLIHSFARPLRLVKIRTLEKGHDLPDFVDDEVSLTYNFMNNILVHDTASGLLRCQWRAGDPTFDRVRNVLYHAKKQQIVVGLYGPRPNNTTRILEFRSIQGEILRRVEIPNAGHLYGLTVDPEHHYIALYGDHALRVYEWDDLSLSKYAWDTSLYCLSPSNWDSHNHQLIMTIKGLNSCRMVAVSMVTNQIVEERSFAPDLNDMYFLASHQCLFQLGLMRTDIQFWSRHENQENLTWADDLGTVEWIYPGLRHLATMYKYQKYICKLV